MVQKFFFDQKRGDKLMSQINLRSIDARAKQWEHPIRSLLKITKAVKVVDRNILRAPKKSRELYCISLLALGLWDAHKEDWWINIPETDPPDGLVATFTREPKGIKGLIREVEVVEHRDNDLFATLQNKLNGTSYAADTIFTCIVFSPGLYDFESLAKKFQNTQHANKHLFLVHGGRRIDGKMISDTEKSYIFSLVQILPKFIYSTFDLRKATTDFETKYKRGRESRLIENGQIYYGTANTSLLKR